MKFNFLNKNIIKQTEEWIENIALSYRQVGKYYG